MEMQELLVVLRRYWRSITAVVLLAVCLAGVASLLSPKHWTAQTALFVAVESGGTAGELSQGATYAERQVKSLVEVANSPFVLQPVIDELGLDTTPEALTATLTVRAPVNTSVIEIASTRTDKDEAVRIANAAGESLGRAVDDLSPKGRGGERLVQATIIRPAIAPNIPTSPQPAKNLVIGLVLGLLLAAGQALVRNHLDTRVRTSADIAQITESAVIGVIGKNLGTSVDGYSQTDEAFRSLRTNLGFLGLAGQRRPSIVITSSIASEGKTETSVRLAKSLAEAGDRVLLVDSDLRRPQVANRLGLEGAVGFSHVLSGQATAWELTQPGGVTGLDVLPAGAVPPNPAELLASDAMHTFLRAAEDRYDYVLFDAPPLLPVTDAAVLSSQTGGAIIVARSGAVNKQELELAMESLQAAGGDPIGIVLNDVTRESGGLKYADYHYRRKAHGLEVAGSTSDRVRKTPDPHSIPAARTA